MTSKDLMPKKLSFFQNIRKQIVLSFMTEKKAKNYINNNHPSYLKNDVDVVKKVIEKLQQSEETKVLSCVIDENPWAINMLEPNFINSLLYSGRHNLSIQYLPIEKQKELLAREVEYDDKWNITPSGNKSYKEQTEIKKEKRKKLHF